MRYMKKLDDYRRTDAQIIKDQQSTIEAMAETIKDLERIIEYLPSVKDLDKLVANVSKLEELQGRVK